MNSKISCLFWDIKIIFSLFLLALSPFPLSAEQLVDSDGDGLSDVYEKKIGTEAFLFDTDGDGLSDGVEVGSDHEHPINTDADRYIDALDFDDDNDGLPTVLESKNDTDHDGLKDYLDPDSDNDNVSDGIEAGMLNRDQNVDLIDDAFDSEQIGAIDKNGDGVNDLQKFPDYNNDGIPDYLDPKYNKVVGKITLSKTQIANKTPLNNLKNHQDHKAPVSINAKNKRDGDLKKISTQLKIDKRKKAFKKTVASASIEARIKERNDKLLRKLKKERKNLELVLKNKEQERKRLLNQKALVVKHKEEKPKARNTTKTPKKQTISLVNQDKDIKTDLYLDTDNDGLLDSLERILGTDPLKRDTDGDKVSDAIEIGMDINAPQDSDHDKIIDALDPDDDNDGILTKNEDVNNDSSPINDDTDEDGVPNYLDANDDGDNRLTREEGGTKDTDHDGILDYLDNDDGVKYSKTLKKDNDVVVLYDGNLEYLGQRGSYGSSKKRQQSEKNLAEETIENASLDRATAAKNNKEEDKGTGVISWITSLLPN